MQASSGYTILLADDSDVYLDANRRLLESQGHQVLTATSGASALDLLRKHKVDLVLLDYFMPGMTGEEVVTELRKFNSYVQVILQTGYASEQPARSLLRRLDIQGYCDKSEGPEKLLLWTEVGLKAAYTVQLLNKSRIGLHYILDATVDLHRFQSLSDLLKGILVQVTGLLGAVDSFLAYVPEENVRSGADPTQSFLAMLSEDEELVIQASTGCFEGQKTLQGYLSSERLEVLSRAVRSGEILIEHGITAVPLRVDNVTLGVVYLDRAAVLKEDIALLKLFANQASVAIQNAQLYEVVLFDQLTGCVKREFFERMAMREVRAACEQKHPISLLIVDVEAPKTLGNGASSAAEEAALRMVGHTLANAIRSTDRLGRYSDGQFAVLLPGTPRENAELVAKRMLEAVDTKDVSATQEDLPPARVSIGLATVEPARNSEQILLSMPKRQVRFATETLFKEAEEALAKAKGSGKNAPQLRVCVSPAISAAGR